MEPRSKNCAALVFSLASCFGGCTGYVQPGGDSASSAPSTPPAAADSSSSTTTFSASTSSPKAVAWSGSVGSWCGAADSQTVWLGAGAQAASCELASAALSATLTAPHVEGLALQLDAATLAPGRSNVPARYCTTSNACVDVQVALGIAQVQLGQSLVATWSFTRPDGSVQSGSVNSGWCHWDDFLPPHPDADRLARDIKIREVSVYQGVKIPVAWDGQAVATRNADLVQSREALVRVFVDPAPSFESRQLSARITLQDEGKAPRFFEQHITIKGPSTDEDGGSTFNLELPKDAFGPTTTYAVELREMSRCSALPGVAVGARFPEQGLAPVGARMTGPVKVMLVPVRYEADGSHRLPDTSAEQLARMSKRLYSMYPTTEVMISVRDSVATDRTDLSDMLDQMRALRDTDAPPSDLSYYGLVRQAETFDDYCQGTCTTGIAGYGSMNGTAGAGMGIGFAEAAANTFVHELGHIYRRPHAPCGGVGAPDQSYPYPSAGLGSWGYDIQTRELFEPLSHVDFMSYCSPDWISDYNYQQILERIVVVNRRALLRRIGTPVPRTFRTLMVAKNGSARWGLDLHPQLDPPGDHATIKAVGALGSAQDIDAFYEDGPDGDRAYFIPAGHAEWQSIQVPGAPAIAYDAPSQNQPFTL